ncbi:MAG: cell division protein BolA [Sedimenticola sp.]|jgi:hypothetical protein|nr:MAG: cell division protein BolA [Sedimenticola sp.]
MSVCSRIKGFTRHHEHIADLFSLLAVVLLFASIWFAIDYQGVIFHWMKENVIINGSLMILAIVVVVFMIFALLNIGSARFSEGDTDACFGTFKGRRHGGTSIGSALKNWVNHIEHVNKKHR